MKLYIHTYGRAGHQLTWNWLPSALRKHTALVVQKRESGAYAGHPGEVIVLPDDIRTLSPTRQWIMNYHYTKYRKTDPKLCLLDDDLRFDKRRMDQAGLFVVATPDDVIKLFMAISKELDKYVHVGVLSREGGNRVEVPRLYATRMMRVLAYDVRVVRSNGARFDRVPCKQDFDMTLQLLKAGYPNVVICDYVQGQGGSQKSGGCSSYRTLDMMAKTCRKL